MTQPIKYWNPGVQVALTPIQQLQRNGYPCALLDPMRDPVAEILAREGDVTRLVILSLVNSRASAAVPLAARGFVPFSVSAANTPSTVTVPRSLIAERFARELIEVLCPQENSGPLVLDQWGALRFVYKSDQSVALADYQHGLDFSDTDWDDRTTLDIDCTHLAVDRCPWRFNRSPLEVPRSELPEWDGKIAKQLHRLVAEYVKRDELAVLQPRVEQSA